MIDTLPYYCGRIGTQTVAQDAIYRAGYGPPVISGGGGACSPSLLVMDAKSSLLTNPPLGTFAMYYECPFDPVPNHMVSQVCVQFSNDGVTFQLPHLIEPAPSASTYGAGHPSAIYPADGGFIYLFFYQELPGGAKGMFLQKLWPDGITPYGSVQPTNAHISMKIKYYVGPGAWNGIFIGVSRYEGRTYLNWSSDGISWDWSDPQSSVTGTLSEMGKHYAGWSAINAQWPDGPGQVTGGCVAPGPPGLAADGYGRIETNDGSVTIYEGEGLLSTDPIGFPDVTGNSYFFYVQARHPECKDLWGYETSNNGSPYWRGFTWRLFAMQGQLVPTSSWN